ncbi:ribonuclease P protein component [Jannaschia formosa]|uniref:ribonuclease P protein component n=1 Tax=Jannaschia formosa TaxID=2259592 RepID=UPI000E1BDF43|nr:ribonuclease P protein component [Jannaschia formosa]TFL17381.1 ribonuclease P protein component [Jannaschia formosa]
MSARGTTPEAAAPPASLRVLKARPEFLALARARRAPAGSFLLQARDRGDGDPAIGVGFTCSKKVGNAVARNRAKRRLREAARAVLPGAGRPGWDYALIGRAEATAARPFPLLLDDLREALARVHR